jgi:E3 ubiquitin-protein ligase CHFR
LEIENGVMHKKRARTESKQEFEQSAVAIEPDEPEDEEDDTKTRNVWARLESQTQRFPSENIISDTFTIGRGRHNDLIIKDTQISSQHCSIHREHKPKGVWIYWLEDMSKNGTFQNGKKLGKGVRTRLYPSDEIELRSGRRAGRAGTQPTRAIDPPRFVFKPSPTSASRAKPTRALKGRVEDVKGLNKPKKEKIQKKSQADIEENRQGLDVDLMEEMKCWICTDVMYQAVTTMPCLHSVKSKLSER